jgi:hypothetical protein
VWSPLCFILYVTNLNIDWNFTSFNLETFKLIKDRLSKYKPKDLLEPEPSNGEITKFNVDLITSANNSEKTKKTSLNSITNWGLEDENKMFLIIMYLSTMKIVQTNFIKNINQEFVDCMYSIFNKYPGGPAEYKTKNSGAEAQKCFEKII